MFAKYTTSKIIAIKFTIYVVCVLVFFGMIANFFFFKARYFGESTKLSLPPVPHIQEQSPSTPINTINDNEHEDIGEDHHREKFIRNNLEVLPYSADLDTSLQEHTIFGIMSKIDNEYVLYTRDGDTFKVVTITHLVDAQYRIFYITLFSTLILGFITFLLSKYFVRSSLYRLYTLSNAVEGITIENLDIVIPLSGPANDEVRIIGSKLQNSLSVVKQQTIALKDFVANASHELKTPLMQIGGQVDYLTKAGTDYTTGLRSIKNTIKSMNVFIEELLTLAKLESQKDISMITEVDISTILQTTIHTFQKVYVDKNIEIQSEITDHIMKKISSHHFQLIINNLLDNAYKYTQAGTINVYLDDSTLSIQDTGQGIQKDNLHKIRDKFRQEDASKTDRKSFGLGLSLVKKIIYLYGWEIAVQSEEKEGTIFTITMI